MVFLRKMVDKIGFKQQVENLMLHSDSNRGYSPASINETFLVSIWCGANRFFHTELTRHDQALKKYLGGSKHQIKTYTKDIFQNLHKQPISVLVITFIHGYLIRYNLIILHLIVIHRY